MKTDKIYLVGFMAAGKTTLAQALARRLGWRAEDVDLLIEARERRTVAEIFARDGEPYFRSIERQVIWSLLPQRHAVVATGGGTFIDPENRAAINADGVSVWIDVPFEVLLNRIPADGRRPLANDRVQMALLYESRRLAYQQAQMRLDASRARVGRAGRTTHRAARVAMRYLVLSDIHSNLEALDAVLRAAAAQKYDAVLVLGDLVGYGADPNAVVDRMRGSAPVAIVRGNHDKVAAGLDNAEDFNPMAKAAAQLDARGADAVHARVPARSADRPADRR